MQFKQSPEDFIVEEVLPPGFVKSSGKYEVYKLVKQGIDTLSVINELENRFGDIGYAGLKDKHGVTTQYITALKGTDIKKDNYSITKIGYSDDMLDRGDNLGNKFNISIDVTSEEKEKIKNNTERIKQYGFKNYYDTQRTGHELETTSMVHYLLKSDYKTALLRYYIHKSKYANRTTKLAYKDCFKNWDTPEKCYRILKDKVNNLVLRPLKTLLETNNYLEAIKKIPGYELELQIAGYQAILFNKSLDLINEEKTADLPVIELPKEIGFKARKGKRATIVRPERLEIIYKDNSVKLLFFLPAGAYATVLLKSLIDSSLSSEKGL